MHGFFTGWGVEDQSRPIREVVSGSRYTTTVEGHCRIFYTMSTWNPYQVMVMRSDLKLKPAE
jgi:hypothetical protein